MRCRSGGVERLQAPVAVLQKMQKENGGKMTGKEFMKRYSELYWAQSLWKRLYGRFFHWRVLRKYDKKCKKAMKEMKNRISDLRKRAEKRKKSIIKYN